MKRGHRITLLGQGDAIPEFARRFGRSAPHERRAYGARGGYATTITEADDVLLRWLRAEAPGESLAAGAR